MAQEASDSTAESPETRIDEDAAGNPYVAGELIVTYEEHASGEAAQTANREAGALLEENLPDIDTAVLSVPEVMREKDGEKRERDLDRKKRELEADPSVESVDYNYVRERLATPNDPYFGSQWGLRRIRVSQAWSTTRGTGAVIAIVDGGARSSHPDLNGAVIGQRDFYDRDDTPNDEDGHGTHVSGIAAARTDNGSGIAGTAPGASLLNYDVCGAQYCDDASVIAAIKAATDRGANVINISLGGSGGSTSVENAVNYAWNRDAVVVAAAGNQATSARRYPAAYTNVIAVSGTAYRDGNSDFSNYGSWVDIAAPGGETTASYEQRILSSVPRYIQRSRHDAWNGTSMAAPFVSGVAAMLSAQNLSAPEIRKRIQATATDLSAPGKDAFFGHGW
jgi:thermitase